MESSGESIHDESAQAGSPTRPGVAAALAATLLTTVSFVGSGLLRHTYPFGTVSRSINDLGAQFVPMHAHLRDVLTGEASGDFIFNWGSGFGVQFIPDFLAYLGTPFSWLVVLFPRHQIDLAAYVITIVSLSFAAAAMAVYLLRLRPNAPWWLAGISGASYAMCGWAIDDASYMMVWLNGLIAFPLLCLIGEWALRRKLMVLSALLVALLWTAHFYIAYMATIGAGIVVVARVLSLGSSYPASHRIKTVARWAFTVGLGIALAAPLLLPTFRAVRGSRPSPEVDFDPIGVVHFVSRLLPATEDVAHSPGLAVGTLMLLLAASFPVNRAIAARTRVVWTAAVALTVLSMQLDFTHFIWHGFDTPNGSPYRQAFVIAGMLVILGWLSASHGLRGLTTSLVPLVVLAALYIVAFDRPWVTPTTRVAVPIVAGVLVLAGILVRVAKRLRWRPLGVVSIGLIIVTVAAEFTFAAAAIDAARYGTFKTFPTWSERSDLVRELVRKADDWPTTRTDTSWLMTPNDPMLFGGQGGSFYSSTMPDALSQTLLSLGYGYSSYGRAVIDPQDPVTDTIFSIGARVVADKSASGGYQLETRTVAPLVTFRPGAVWDSDDPIPFGPQETALGADVYDVPLLQIDPDPGVTVAARGKDRLVISAGPGVETPSDIRLTGRCAAGTTAYFWGPEFVGEVRLGNGQWMTVLAPGARRPGVYTGAPLRHLGPVQDGRIDLSIRVTGTARLPTYAIGCLDEQRLADATAALTNGAPERTEITGHRVHIDRSKDPAGTLVLATGRVQGWSCSVDNESPRTPDTLAGLVAVPVEEGARSVTCSFRPPGLRLGLAVGLAALVIMASVGLVSTMRRRRASVVDQRQELGVEFETTAPR